MNVNRKPISSAPVTDVPIADIVIGVRRRDKMGQIQRLASSIDARGLLHPIVLSGLTLVAGHRRLEACRSLKWTTIPARQFDTLSEEDLRAIELEENTHREALSDYATSKARLAEIRQAEADLRVKAEKAAASNVQSLDDTPTVSKRGRVGEGQPKKAGSVREVEKATGISKGTIRNVEKHVEIAERYPALQRPAWRQHHVLEAGAVLDKMPEHDRSSAAALLDQDFIPPKAAIDILENLAAMPATARREVFTMAQSADAFVRKTALTKAAALPPPVDQGLSLLEDAAHTLERAAKLCRVAAWKDAIKGVAAHACRVREELRKENAHARGFVSAAGESSGAGDSGSVYS